MTDAPPKSVIAIDLGGHNLRGCLINEGGQILHRRESPTVKGRGPEKVLRQLAKLVEEISHHESAHNTSIQGVGIGIPGFINHKEDRMYKSPNFPGWEDLNLGETLTNHLPLPFAYENDANCAALGEWWKGSARGHQNFVCLTLGTGVGGGVLIEGKMLRGSRGAGAELGHIVVDPEGPPCGCGGNGCLEQTASGGALERSTGMSATKLAHLAKEGNAKALDAYRQFGRFLGIGLSSICQIFDPEIVILGGRVSNALDLFVPSVKVEMRERLKNHPTHKIDIVQGECGDNAGLLGAAWLIIDNYA